MKAGHETKKTKKQYLKSSIPNTVFESPENLIATRHYAELVHTLNARSGIVIFQKMLLSRLREELLKANVSVGALCELLSLTSQEVSDLLTGKRRIEAVHLLKIEEVFQIPAFSLF